jgi:hypothetical protein
MRVAEQPYVVGRTVLDQITRRLYIRAPLGYRDRERERGGEEGRGRERKGR